MISKNVKQIVESPSNGVIRKMFEEGALLKQKFGAENVYDFSIGNPDLDPPQKVCDAVKEVALDTAHLRHGYMPNPGYTETRQAMAKKTSIEQGVEIDFSNVVMSVGAAGAINATLKALLNPGDEVLIPQPSYVSYEPCTVLAGGVPVIINLKAENEFRLTKDELLEAITPKTKVLVLPFPNNPTGAIMEQKDLEEIVEVIIEKDIFVISDEIYSELTYGRNHVTIASLPGMKERTILINGFSKAFAMTGWRLGYACGPKEIMEQMIKIHQFAIMCAPTNSQYAGVDALRNSDDDVEYMRETYDGRRRYLMHAFRELKLDCFEPYGAFYVFPCIKEFGMTSDEFATKLLEEERVAVVPGTAFGECGEGFIRISYAYSLDDLKLAIEHLKSFIERLRAR